MYDLSPSAWGQELACEVSELAPKLPQINQSLGLYTLIRLELAYLSGVETWDGVEPPSTLWKWGTTFFSIFLSA